MQPCTMSVLKRLVGPTMSSRGGWKCISASQSDGAAATLIDKVPVLDREARLAAGVESPSNLRSRMTSSNGPWMAQAAAPPLSGCTLTSKTSTVVEPSASRDAELVAFGVEHHDVAEVLAV
jgi:hypothetical protein